MVSGEWPGLPFWQLAGLCPPLCHDGNIRTVTTSIRIMTESRIESVGAAISAPCAGTVFRKLVYNVQER